MPLGDAAQLANVDHVFHPRERPVAYRALEKLLADGRVRAIGVSNFMPEHALQAHDSEAGAAATGVTSRGAVSSY